MNLRPLILIGTIPLLLTAALNPVLASVPPLASVCKPAALQVTVKIGQASLEEYHAGNPPSRTQIYRIGEDAHLPIKKATEAKMHRA